MASRILTPEGTFCSNCGEPADPDGERCPGCGQPYVGAAEGVRCPACARVAEVPKRTCPSCGTALPSVAAAFEGKILEKIREFREAGRAEAMRLEKAPGAYPEADEDLLAEFDSMWKLSEPFERIMTSRRLRLERMDRLVAVARRRIRELEGRGAPADVRERRELKRQIEEMLADRDQILTIELGITQMERIYRNILTIQQRELRSKEASLRARLEAFRQELERRDAEGTAIAEQLRYLETRERALESRTAAIETRERELQAHALPPGAPPADTDVDPMAAARRTAAGLFEESSRAGRAAEAEVSLGPAEIAVRDLRIRISELEEDMEKVVEEKHRLERELVKRQAEIDALRTRMARTP